MKKIFFVAAMLLSSLLVTAQVKISREGILPSSVEIQFKRCIVSGEDGFLDLVLTNRGKGCKVSVGTLGSSSSIYIYDDEGNILKKGDGVTSIKFAGEESYHMIEADFPTDVPMALRINLRGVNEFATKFTLVKIQIASYDWGYVNVHNWPTIVLRNVPIERRN